MAGLGSREMLGTGMDRYSTVKLKMSVQMTYNLYLLFSSAQQFSMLTIFLQREAVRKNRKEKEEEE